MEQNATTIQIKKKKRKGRWSEVWRRLKKSKSAMIGMVVMCIFLLVAIFAGFIADYETEVIAQNSSQRLLPPSSEHWFGTDNFGRDVFARIVHGTRYSLMLGALSSAFALLIGGILGALAGYFGGRTGIGIMGVMDTIMCIPPTLMALAVVAALGPNFRNLIIAITISNCPGFARLVRSVVMQISGQEFIEAAKANGSIDIRILFKHVIPNVIGPIIVQATTSVGALIISAAALSFLGMGVQPPAPEWGSMLSNASEYMRQYPNLVLAPGLSIVFLTLSINLFGDGLRDALDPRLRD